MVTTYQIVADNETYDVTPTATLLTIGAVVARIDNGKIDIVDEWYERIEWLDGAQKGRSISESTINWWEKQRHIYPQAYQEALLDIGDSKKRIPLKDAMLSFSEWICKHPYPIWGNGSDFDNAQLKDAFLSFGMEWPYRRNRCLRSLRGAVESCVGAIDSSSIAVNKFPHHALYDAVHEAHILAHLLQYIRTPM